MALALNDRVQQQGTANTTVSFTLTSAVTGFQSFAVIGDGNTTYYGATDTVGNWEVGVGTYASSGPTLTRTTILSSSNSNSAVTFSGPVNVFVTYPSEKSVNYDENGSVSIGEALSYSDTGIVGSFASTTAGYNQLIVQNKSSATNASANINLSNDVTTSTFGFAELGINSSTFSGAGSFNIAGASYLASASTDLTLGTYGAYNVHFVTNSNTTDSMTIFNDGGMSLGGFGNPGLGSMAGNKFVPGYTEITASASTIILTSASTYYQKVVGTTTQTIQLPDATTLLNGTTFIFDNDSTGLLSITDGATTVIDTVQPGSIDYLFVEANTTVAGSWGKYSWLPSSYDFNTTSANLGGATISGAIWQGTPVASGYGGTGLNTFSAANYALYSTSPSTLAAGTLPVAAGGTGQTTYTDGQLLIGNSTGSTLTKASLTAGTGISITPGSGSITIASTIANGLTITNDTSTATPLYPTFTNATSGSITSAEVSSTKLNFTPSTGALAAPEIEASNGMLIHSATVSTSYSIPAGSNAIAVGPMTVASGATVTVPSGSRWLVL